MLRPVRHWPGGIPRAIRPHPNGDLTLDEIKEEVKGWLLFVQESWVPRSRAAVADEDEEYELCQRRANIDRWASAPQEFCEGSLAPKNNDLAQSQSRAMIPCCALEHVYQTAQVCDSDSVMALAPLNAATHPFNQARWVEFAILLYRYDVEAGHYLRKEAYLPSAVHVNPTTTAAASASASASAEDFLIWMELEVSFLPSIYLTRSGTVLHLGYPGPYLLVDKDGPRTGCLTLVEF